MFTPDNLPNLLKQLEQFKDMLGQANASSLWAYLDECQGTLQKAQESLRDPKHKQILGEVLGKAASARKDVEALVPEVLEKMKQQQKDSFAFINEFSAKIEQTERDFQDKLRQEAELAASVSRPPEAAPLPAVDAGHGGELALDLLQSLGLLETAKDGEKFDDLGSVARYWTDTDEKGHEESGAARAEQAAAERPALQPRRSTPLRRPPKETKRPVREENLDQSIGKESFEEDTP